jgi:hypothetical protein
MLDHFSSLRAWPCTLALTKQTWLVRTAENFPSYGARLQRRYNHPNNRILHPASRLGHMHPTKQTRVFGITTRWARGSKKTQALVQSHGCYVLRGRKKQQYYETFDTIFFGSFGGVAENLILIRNKHGQQPRPFISSTARRNLMSGPKELFLRFVRWVERNKSSNEHEMPID